MLAHIAVVCAVLLTSTPANAANWPFGVNSPAGRPCCGSFDCHPRRVRLNTDTMRLEIWMGGRWWQATDPRWYLGESPTGAWVGCQSRGDPTPRCVFGGGGV
jgi:hypothetical protein